MTLTIAIFTAGYSILNFEMIEKRSDLVLNDSKVIRYTKDLKSYLLAECYRSFPGNDCAELKNTSNVIFNPKISEKILKKRMPKKMYALMNWDKIKESNQNLYARRSQILDETNLYDKKNVLLSRKNAGFLTALNSLFLHANYIHLFGNLIILLIIGSYVEARLRPYEFLLLYLAGGIFAALMFIYSNNSGQILVGASTSIAALTGSFLFFFKRNKLKTLVSFLFVFNRVAYIPVIVYIPFVFVLSDVYGLSSGESSVAYAAHLYGFFFGVMAAFLHEKLSPLPETFSLPQEMVYWSVYKSTTEDKKIAVLCNWFLLNPNSLFSLKEIANDNSIRHPLIKNQFNECFKLNYKKIEFYNAISLKSLEFLDQSLNVEYLIHLYEKLKNSDDHIIKMKLLYLVCNSLDWNSKEWNENFKKECLEDERSFRIMNEIAPIVIDENISEEEEDGQKLAS